MFITFFMLLRSGVELPCGGKSRGVIVYYITKSVQEKLTLPSGSPKLAILISHGSRTSISRQSSPELRRASGAADAIGMGFAIDRSSSRYCIDAGRIKVVSVTAC
jgi:hypothetical protein